MGYACRVIRPMNATGVVGISNTHMHNRTVIQPRTHESNIWLACEIVGWLLPPFQHVVLPGISIGQEDMFLFTLTQWLIACSW